MPPHWSSPQAALALRYPDAIGIVSSTARAIGAPRARPTGSPRQAIAPLPPYMEALVRDTESRFGRIDILVANSPGTLVKPFEQLTDDDWRIAFNSKLVTQARQARLVWQGMVARGYGRILFIAGTHGRQPHAQVLTAGVINAGLLSLAKGLAEAGAPHGVLVNAVNPGPTDTDRMRYLVARKASEEGVSTDEARSAFTDDIVLRRFGDPAEIGAAIAFLASDRASFVTGVSFNVDGGQTRTI